MAQQVKDFFLRFEHANAASDVGAIGSLYADSFTFAGPEGALVVKKADFLRILPNMKMQFSSMGISETKLQTVEARPLDSKYLLVSVVWRMKIGNSSDSKTLDASATYILQRGEGDEVSIVVQIDHQDLATLLRAIPSTSKSRPEGVSS